ncbi:hypothetical protein A3D00_03025 [Candidatus Woesebacteria bacterium RIFCSPHIGHO2_02_FULL_38_9]|uniref:CAAX prenyl protease 2/Lysostaphin resistance protein A-like domain-containing protein n=1 Tax=Candidatus Woesebacteria bacterium RIFCSPHIGHO2_01_FULL_39_28 TaxID=1802496 RepID=A0A1F7Y8T6_9BACT|nr:MAG: hypothetical protein A2627_02110 [Candidatus Woesebacteria bacterium RIFCSPHIGHO2_01_FULL_39_28]OGM33746.1 MAG: hypothetical protein A3D00_03025 [Candidatus Woesebacteria bacterium RIFCSPHIGHO2_02_FULL_38_9]OGM57263.1 MAG: hypothetical protein A3A50_00585 [Candidatus Woesebacteria bacterium RIFCSPLOWO2_01_FULL_38_20]
MPKKELAIKHATVYAAYLLIIWGFYRFIFRFPDEVEELIIKPFLWLVPIVILLKKERMSISSLGITGRNLFPSIYLALGLGAVFMIEGLAVNFIKYGGFNFSANVSGNLLLAALGLSFATAFSEEIAFRGFIFNRIWHSIGNEWIANVLTTIIWTLVHLPITVFIWKANAFQVAVYLVLTIIFSLGSGFVFSKTKNVASSIFLHVLWEWPIILFG